MSLLQDLFRREDRPGPGVEPNEPRKKGIRRLWEVCTRDLSSFFGAGLAGLAGILTWMMLVSLALLTRSVAGTAVAGALGGMIAAPELCALTDLILRGLRDEPFYGWSAWRKAWKGSLKAGMLPGAVLGAAAALERLAVQLILEGNGTPGLLGGVLLGMVIGVGLALYLVSQIVLFDQPLGRTLKNSVLLFLHGLPRSVGAAILLLAYGAGIGWFAPASYVVLILGNIWLPATIALLIIYRPMEQILDLEARVHEVQEQRR